MTDALEWVLDGWAALTLGYYLVVNLLALVFVVVAWRNLRSYERARSYAPADEALASPLSPGITVLLPAYNEEAGVVKSVRSLLALRYPLFEIVVINDGSTDGTLERLTEAFDLVPVRRALRDTVESEPVRGTYAARANPALFVLDKVNGGKADALNAGIRAAIHPLFASIDADAILDEDALLETARPFLDDPTTTLVSGGMVRVSNGCTVDHGRVVRVGLSKSYLASIQWVEYVRAFLVGRIPWSRVNGLLIVSGAFALFRRKAVEEARGYARDTVGEDIELVVRLHRRAREARIPYRIVFVPHPVCWTEGPQDVRTLSRQRRRWQRGLGETLWRHRGMFGKPRYGWVGLGALPYFVFYEFLAPIFILVGTVMTIGWWLAGGLSLVFMALFFTAMLLLGMLLNIAAVTMDQIGGRQRLSNRDLARAMVYAVLLNVGYPQYVQACMTLGYVDLARRKKTWGAQRRRGIGTPSGREVEP